ncbi:MAG: glycoside hydrolase family 3 N-terminal domain-containing protein [Candidatus Zixiibacteriota bacterium]
MTVDKLRKQIGQLFVMGFPGERPPSPFLSFIAEERIGGVILFADNCATHQLARQNIETIKSCYNNYLPFIAIDQEGGRVCRLRQAPVEYRAASAYAIEGIERFEEEYSRAAVYMEALGINLNLAPVADLYLDSKNACLRDRCFGSSAEQVSPFVRASVRISQERGLLSCLKHFPGLGAARNDPHLQTSVADYDEFVWEQREKRPFVAGVEAGADLIMTTHLLLPALDDRIVTGSAKIINRLLRDGLGFDGPVITDDLTMKGAAALGDIGERTLAAFTAGHDLLLFGQDYEAAFQAYDFFTDALRRGEIDTTLVTMSLDRIAGLKFKLGRSVLR